MPCCLYDNTQLIHDDNYDEDVGEYMITIYKCGHCPKCGRDYKWKEEFTFFRLIDLTLDD